MISIMSEIATHCNTLQHTATHRNTLHHTASHCNTLQHTAQIENLLQTATHYKDDCTATYCITCRRSISLVSVIFEVCNTLEHTGTRCTTLQHTVTHCNTLQHTAKHKGSIKSLVRTVVCLFRFAFWCPPENT